MESRQWTYTLTGTVSWKQQWYPFEYRQNGACTGMVVEQITDGMDAVRNLYSCMHTQQIEQALHAAVALCDFNACCNCAQSV